MKIEQVDSVYKNYSSQKNISKTIPKEFEEFKKQVDFYIKETDRFSQMITQKTDKLSKEKMKLDILQQDREELRKFLTKTKKRLSEVSYECTYCHSVLTRGQSLTRMELDDNKIEILLRKDSINQEIIKIENNIQKKLIEIQNLENQFELYHERLS
ncbi:TPA: endonuclease, partial [Staphylococcus aureus]|nr:endonuclease [Staphylococcus aureus]